MKKHYFLLLLCTTVLLSANLKAQESVSPSTDASNAPLITSTPIKVNNDGYCKFVPANSATYVINLDSESYPYLTLYDENLQNIVSGENQISASLSAGHTYYVKFVDELGIGYPATLSITGGALPVKLTSFTADRDGKNIQLKWHTETEENNYGFEIERCLRPDISGAGEPNKEWTKIGFVQGHGSSNSPNDYSFADENPVSGNLQYRLKQIDNDGKYEYYTGMMPKISFDNKDASKQLPGEFSLLQNYPNPFNPSTNIGYSIPKESFVSIKIFNALGEEVTTLVNEVKPMGTYEVLFDASSFSNGIYFYQLRTNEASVTKKMQLLK